MTNVLPRQEALLNQLCQKIDESQATQAAMMRLLGNFRQVDVDVASDYAASLSESLKSRAVAPVITRPRMRSRHEFHIQNIQIHSACPVACTCNCHSRWKVSTPWKLRRLFGHGTIEGVGLPFFKGACSLRSCKGEGATFININFFLPAMVASRLISFWFTSSPLHAPELLLRVPRVLRTDTAAFKAISHGDLDAVKRCISAGECKPWDVDPVGQSLIAVCRWKTLYVFCLLTLAYSDFYEIPKFYDRLVSCASGFGRLRVPQRDLYWNMVAQYGLGNDMVVGFSIARDNYSIYTGHRAETW